VSTAWCIHHFLLGLEERVFGHDASSWHCLECASVVWILWCIIWESSSIQCSVFSLPVGVKCPDNYSFHESLSCAFPFSSYISSLHHSSISSSKSLLGLPLFVFPSISPNTYSFTSLLSSILQMCQNNFNLRSFIRCMMSLLIPVRFHISSFVIILPSYI